MLRTLLTITVLILATPAGAADVERDVANTVPIYCLDSTNTFQPMVGTNYATLSEGFTRQFGWPHSLHATSDTLGYLVFSSNRQKTARERIYYDVEPYNGGIALLHMHVRLQGVTQDLSGTEMCGQTFAILHAE